MALLLFVVDDVLEVENVYFMRRECVLHAVEIDDIDVGVVLALVVDVHIVLGDWMLKLWLRLWK